MLDVRTVYLPAMLLSPYKLFQILQLLQTASQKLLQLLNFLLTPPIKRIHF